MVELLSRIRCDVLDQAQVSQGDGAQEESKEVNPWDALKEVMTARSAEGQDEPEKDNSLLSLVEAAGLRLVDNLAAESHRKESAKLRSTLAGRLEDCHVACMLFALNLGNRGMPWGGVDLVHGSEAPSVSEARIGSLDTESGQLRDVMREAAFEIEIPAMVPLGPGQPLTIVAPDALRREAIDCMDAVALRQLLLCPPGSVSITVLDPLATSLGKLPWSIWPGAVLTDEIKIEAALTAAFEHMKNTASSMDGQDGAVTNVPPSLQILLVYDCPHAYSTAVMQKLKTLALSGVKHGISVIFHWSECPGNVAGSRTRSMIHAGSLVEPGPDGAYILRGKEYEGYLLRLESLPQAPVVQRILEPVVREFSEQSSRSLGFGDILPAVGADQPPASSADGFSIPLGITEQGRVVELELGEGKATHGLIVGGTGSGKSSLMHVIITGLAEVYPPDELEMYLIDLKGGVEFKRYAANRLPHAKVVAIDCEREFALSALDALCEEMQRRMELFRAGDGDVTSVPAYRQNGASLPRVLLVMDEFQKLFSVSDDLADQARFKLGSLLREGRGFGIHVLIGTQSLKGVLLRGGSLEQVALRIVLKCSPEDSRDALASDNPAGCTLPKYHGIYNDQQGSKDANTIFKAAYLSPELNNKRLEAIAARKSEGRWDTVVFEGNERKPLSSCAPYCALQDLDARSMPLEPSIWLGEPIAIQPPVEIQLHATRGRNLLVLASGSGEGPLLLINALLCLLKHPEALRGKVVVLDYLPPNQQARGLLEQLEDHLGDRLLVARGSAADECLISKAQQLDTRIRSGELGERTHIFVFGLQHARALRSEGSYREPDPGTPAGALSHLLKEGSEQRFHIIAWCDMLANLQRCGRGLLEEFGVVAATRLEQQDSAAVFRSPIASRLQRDNRAVLMDDDQPGQVRVFRPYSDCSFTGPDNFDTQSYNTER